MSEDERSAPGEGPFRRATFAIEKRLLPLRVAFYSRSQVLSRAVALSMLVGFGFYFATRLRSAYLAVPLLLLSLLGSLPVLRRQWSATWC